MYKKTCLLIAAVMCTVSLHALTFTVNGNLWNDRDDAGLQALSYPLPFRGNFVDAVSLDELFPAVYEAWRLEIRTKGNDSQTRLTDPDLGENLNRCFLVKLDSGWALFYKNRLFPEISELNLDCERLERAPLEIWINWEGPDVLRTEIKRYAELHDIEITVTEVPKPDSKLISVSRANGRVPDIIMLQSSDVYRLAVSESIQNLDYMFPQGMVARGIDAFSLNGKKWAVPFYFDAQMFFCNPELTETPDADWDLDDFERICRKLKQGGIIPSAWNSYSASFLIPFQMAFGKNRLVEEDGTVIINDEPSVEALKYILDLQAEGLMQPMERDAMTSLFVSGDVAMIISASYSIPHFKELGIPFEAVPLPLNKETGRRLSPLLDFKAMAISRKAHNSFGARRLIEYLCGIGVQQRFTAATAKLPALEQAWELTGIENPYFEALSISADAGTVIPAEKAYSIYKNTMWKMLRFAISGRMPAEQVLNETQNLINKNME